MTRILARILRFLYRTFRHGHAAAAGSGYAVLSATRLRRSPRPKAKPKKRGSTGKWTRPRLDLHIQKVADKMGKERGAGQFFKRSVK